MFKSKAIKALIQNHKDAPHLWAYDPHRYSFTNKTNQAYIEYTGMCITTLYKFNIKGKNYLKSLNYFDKVALRIYFQKVVKRNKPQIPILPTKSKNPEEFI